MAYQNVGTPRFYINIIEWLDVLGILTADQPQPFVTDSRFYTLPVDLRTYEWVTRDSVPLFTIPPILNNQSFAAILGHNLQEKNAWAACERTRSIELTTKFLEHNEIVNWVHPDSTIPYDGFSIFSFNATGTETIIFAINKTIAVGSIVIGTYFDMPHSPDLKLTMTRESGGTKSFRSKNGSSFSNSFYTKPPMWGNTAPWELPSANTGTSTNPALARSGRRVWDLSFSYLLDSSVFPDTASLSRAGEPGYAFNSSTFLDNTLLNDDNFYSQVIHKTNGGQLPFIFQPDNNDNSQFAICRFDMSTFKFTQVANGVYSCKIRVREAW